MAKKKQSKKTAAQTIFRLFTPDEIRLSEGITLRGGKAHICYTADADLARSAQQAGAMISVVESVPEGYVLLDRLYIQGSVDSPSDSSEDSSEESVPEDSTVEAPEAPEDLEASPLVSLDHLTPEQIEAIKKRLTGA